MKAITWLLLLAVAAVLVFGLWRWRRQWAERERAAEERLKSFMAQAVPVQAVPGAQATAKALDAGALLQQKLLLEAATKAGDAGEPALSIQLCARLLARYPDSALAGQARLAVEEQKKKLARP